ncbi:MAG: murein biosynthesis integral membrane protein MurJ [Chloroflexales bacterium]|nr:murein biosynthesis integral membrane protein MurJ [Chloroflexales bacterium]
MPVQLVATIGLVARLRRTPLRKWPTLELSIAEASAVYMLGFLVSAALGVVRQALLNARFGLGPEVAAYYAAFRLPETVATLVAGGALTNALIPVLLRVTARSGEAAGHRLVNGALTLVLAVSAPTCALAFLGAPLFVRLILAPGFDPALQQLTAALARIMLLEVLLVVTEAALVAVLVSRNQILLPAIAIALRNISLIGGIALAFAVPAVGIYGPTIGSIFDALIQLALLVPGLRRRGYRPRLAWAPGDADLRSVGRLLWPNALGGLSNYVTSIVDTAFASLGGATAALGALFNAWLLAGLPIRLLGIAIGQAALPGLAALSIAGNLPELRRVLGRAMLSALGLSLAAAAGLILLGRPVIGLLFERGAFDAAAADLTYRYLAIYALGMPAYVLTEIAARALVARYDTATAMVANLAQLAVRTALLAALIGRLGAAAVPTAHAISAVIETALLLAVLWLKTR